MMEERERVMLIGAALMSVLVTLGFCFAYAASMFMPDVKPDGDLKGALTLAFGGVIGFWTGPVMNRMRKEDPK